MDDKNQTKKSFYDKWVSGAKYQSNGVNSFDKDTLNWILTRNGFRDLEELSIFLGRFPTLLDAGCGNGRILKLFAELTDPTQSLIGIDLAAAEIATENLQQHSNATVRTADLTDYLTLVQLPRSDFIYCQEVLHHTSNPLLSFENLVKILNPGGEIAIYVYKEKAPIREHTDDFVRSLISEMSHEEAITYMKDFSNFGRVLSDVDVVIEVPEVRLLGIPAGAYPIQRLLYHFFVKCYWNPELSQSENDMINFDWYHPSLCSRHTVEEVQNWFEMNELEIVHSYVDEYGITMRGKKRL
jgi:SAM-dependent methyltransferase